jgi:transposase InsO family protein
VNEQRFTTVLRGCLYVPDLKSNLVSISKLDKEGHTIVFGEGKAQVKRNNKTLMVGYLKENLYQVNITPTKISEHVNLAISGDIWHRRLGHYPQRKLTRLAEHVDGLDKRNVDRHSKCESCVQGKLARIPFPPSSTTAKKALEIVSVDLAGPARVESIKGGKYFLVIVDHFSRFYWVEILKKKSDAFDSITKFVLRYENQLETRLKVIRSDGGGEFAGKKWTEWLESKGVIHEVTAPYTPEQNGKAERAVRTIKEGARTMLIDSCLKPKYWAAAVRNFVYVRNRTLTQVSKKKTPFELFYGTVPKVDHLRVFGCVAYAQIPSKHQSTWHPKTTKCVMIGHAQDDEEPTKGYLLYDPYKRNTFKCATVDFWEDQKWNDAPQLRAREDIMVPEVEEDDDEDPPEI